jgi:hypothetical protein
MLGLLIALLATPTVSANELDRAFEAAARQYDVPVELLEAIGWEATRWNQRAFTIWGGYGIMDLQEGDQDPSLEHAAAMLGVSPDLLVHDASWNIRGGAAILAFQARLAHHGRLPDPNDLLAWWDAVRAFSRSDDPTTQALYATTIYNILNTGAQADTAWGPTRLFPVVVNHWDRVPVSRSCGDCDYSGAVDFISASGANYSDYSRSGSDISYVVIHTVQGSYSGCISWFQNPDAEASAHYVVRSSDGQVTQMVREEDVAWHAGNWDYNLVSVGIEHEGYVDDASWYTDAMYRGSAALVSDIISRTHVVADRSHILAHSEVPGATHTDPGSNWDWDYYMSLLTGGTTATGNILGVVADTDIYNGDRIAGATVWLETGETVSTDETGVFEFFDEPLGSYTIHAVASGFHEGTCTKDVTGSGDWWCSIALTPDDGTTDTGSTDSDGTDSGAGDTAQDTGGPGDGPGDNPPERPGDMVPLGETGDCGCQSPMGVANSFIASLSFLLALARRRRPTP